MKPDFGSTELEVALLIRAEDPRRLADDIAALAAVGVFRLLPGEPVALRDLHLDTRERMLSAHHLGLRLRTIGAGQWITLKGPSRPTAFGGTERLELEAPWSLDAVDRIVEALEDHGVSIRRPERLDAPPLQTLIHLGLVVVQNRETRRWPRRVVRVGDPTTRVRADLAVDAVIFHFERRDVRLFEVEVEAAAPDGSEAVSAVAAELRRRYGPVLQPWPHGKLVTGEVIEDLLRQGVLDGLLDAGGLLMPAAYDRIEEACASREAGA